MGLLSVVRDVCAVNGILLPQSVFSNITGNRTMQEMLVLANEMAQRIAYDTREWEQLIKVATVTGDGTATAFPLPADYHRMLKNGNVWRSTSTQQPMRFINDVDEWMVRRASSEADAWGEWTLMGGDIHIYPAMAAGVTARYAYLHRNCIKLVSGGFGTEFQNDNDTTVLDERLLKLGMIFQWKAYKGAPYAEDMTTYADALTNLMGSDKPAPTLIGRVPTSFNARVAYPWALGPT